MKRKLLLQNFFIVLTFLFFGNTIFAFTFDSANSDLDVQLIVTGCNNNLMCEAGLGEDTATCPLDCPAVATTTEEVVTQDDNDQNNRPGNRRNFDAVNDTGQTSNFDNTVNLYDNLTVFTGTSDVVFSWLTPYETRSSIQIGVTSDFEKFSSYEFSDTTNHFFYFTNLIPGKTYFYRIDSQEGITSLKSRFGSFTTKQERFNEEESFVAPSSSGGNFQSAQNITVKKSPDNFYSEVSWNNPSAPSFSGVTVVRTVGDPAKNKNDGVVVYEGANDSVTDSGILDNQIYFYTAFSNYENGSVSTGVSVRFDTSRIEKEIVYGDTTFNLYNIVFKQGGDELTYGSVVLDIDPYVPVVISLKKYEMFTPVEDLHLSVEIYNEDGNFLLEESTKLFFDNIDKTYFRTHQTALDPGNELIFSIIKDNGTRQKIVIGKMKVGTYIGNNEFLDKNACLELHSGIIALIISILVCFYPIPQIILTIILLVFMWLVRKRVFTR